jgi:hypothetical protein
MRGVFVVYLLGLGWLVFAPGGDAQGATGVVVLAAERLGMLGFDVPTSYVVLEFVANLALFVPFGALLAITAPRLAVWAVAATGFGSSVLIEVVQLVVPDRYSTLSDVIANTLGALAGALIVAAVRRRREPSRIRRAPAADEHRP